jgi:hypothetical protein
MAAKDNQRAKINSLVSLASTPANSTKSIASQNYFKQSVYKNKKRNITTINIIGKWPKLKVCLICAPSLYWKQTSTLNSP